MKRPIPIYLAVEDELSELVLRRVLSERPVDYCIAAVFSRGGSGYLRRSAPGFNQAARRCPFLLLTDLDRVSCPPELISEWLGAGKKHRDFLLRVAVTEVESWLLGDATGLRDFLGSRAQLFSLNPEGIAEPKTEVLALAESASRRDVREALVRRDKDGSLHYGPDYNGTLGRFVQKKWNLVEARRRCPSLDRLIKALERLEQRLGKQRV